MSQDRTYYRAEGRTLERVKEWEAARKETEEKVVAFAERFGAERCFYFSDPFQLAGLIFDAEHPAPEGWRKEKDGSWVPYRTTPEGKALYKEMASIKGKSLGSLLGAKRLMIRGNRRYFVSLEQIGNAWYIGVPNTNENEPFFTPEDAVPLKMSEYWALKEAEGKA